MIKCGFESRLYLLKKLEISFKYDMWFPRYLVLKISLIFSFWPFGAKTVPHISIYEWSLDREY